MWLQVQGFLEPPLAEQHGRALFPEGQKQTLLAPGY